MSGEQLPQGCCQYCGGPFGTAEPKIVRELKFDPLGAGRFANPEMAGSKHRVVAVAICSDCTELKRFTSRGVFAAMVGAERIAQFTDLQLQQVGRGLIQPYYEIRNHGDVPAEPWKGHVDVLELRVALAALELDINLTEPERHPSGRPCGVCSIQKSPEGWRGSLVAGHPICFDCEAERLVSGPNVAGRRLRSVFAGLVAKIIPMDPHDLKAFMECDAVTQHPSGFPKRFGYLNTAEREALKRFATNAAWRSVPQDWVTRYRKQPAPAKAPAKVSAVGV